MAKKKKVQNPQQVDARTRAEVIMKVRSGFLTATEGAALLGVSRKTYYKWENRALTAMLGELENKDSGRPKTPTHITTEAGYKHQLEELEKEKENLQKQLELKDIIHQMKLDDVKMQVAVTHQTGSKKKR